MSSLDTISNDLSAYEGQELSISERPELTAARVVISGGIDSLPSHMCIL